MNSNSTSKPPKTAKAVTERIHLATDETVTIDLDIDLKRGKDGNYRFALVIETSEGTIFLKGFRVDSFFTDVLMPVLPMGNFTSPFYLGGMSVNIRSAIIERFKKLKADGVIQ